MTGKNLYFYLNSEKVAPKLNYKVVLTLLTYPCVYKSNEETGGRVLQMEGPIMRPHSHLSLSARTAVLNYTVL